MSTFLTNFSHDFFMYEALKEAQKSFEVGEIPVGAIIVHENTIIARAHNMTEKLQDVTAHAELIAITSASNTLNFKYLTGCKLYVTLEPCVMCAGALAWSQISEIYYGANDLQRGFSVLTDSKLFPKKIKIENEILTQECEELLKKFFKKLRH
ncbi:nucleoside deaminase [Bernardetia sp.]|uniref:nucleoside deaminase n=1 Tax=Bernardetia sp. TaxID=1937974 RepID=UPI0025B8D3A3|nr:nucleoside deaminase [Bernardetia sp.]